MFKFLEYIIKFLNDSGIQYMLSGSVAMGAYTIPRSTRDFDFIVNMSEDDIDLLVKHFAKGFYCDPDAVKEAVSKKVCLILLIIHQDSKQTLLF